MKTRTATLARYLHWRSRRDAYNDIPPSPLAKCLLRLKEEAAKELEFRNFVGDLRAAARLAACG
jgi:hypothetical protein